MKFKKLTAALLAFTACVSLSGCTVPTEKSGGTRAETEGSTYVTTAATSSVESEETSETTAEETETETSFTEETELQTEEEVPEESEDTAAELKGIRPEFKEALDAYEEFFDEYCIIMKKYMENPLDMSILTEYYEFMEKADEWDEKIEAMDEGEMSDEEFAYYMEVTTRVLTKMLEIYQ